MMDPHKDAFDSFISPFEQQSNWVLFDGRNEATTTPVAESQQPPEIPCRRTSPPVSCLPILSPLPPQQPVISPLPPPPPVSKPALSPMSASSEPFLPVFSSSNSNASSSNAFQNPYSFFETTNVAAFEVNDSSLPDPIQPTTQQLNFLPTNSYIPPPIPPRRSSGEDLLIDGGGDQLKLDPTTKSEKSLATSLFSESANYNNLLEFVSSPTPSMNDDIFSGEILMRPPVPTTPSTLQPEVTKSTSKKRKGGYEHLDQSDDDDSQTIDVIITDVSPAKPLSRWTRMENEEDDGREQVLLVGGVKPELLVNDEAGSNDGMLFDDLSIGGDDFDNSDRLSADSCALKGFNRVDKGSQNNLVDFSEADDQRSSFLCLEEEDDDDTTHNNQLIDDVGTTTTPFVFELSEEMRSLDTGTPNFRTTNPFTSAFVCETFSNASSTELNPFEKVNFTSSASSTPSTPANVAAMDKRYTHTSSSSASTTPIPILPPPPNSGTGLSGSRQHRRHRAPSQSSASSTLTRKTTTSVVSTIDDKTTIVSAATEQANIAIQLFHTDENDDSNLLLSNDDENMVVVVENAQAQSPDPFDSFFDIMSTSERLPDDESSCQPVVEGLLGSGGGSVESLVDERAKQVERCKLLPPDLIPTATCWEMEMRFPQQKRVMSSRRWVPICVRINVEDANCPSLNLYHNTQSTHPFFAIYLGKNDWQMTQPKLQHGRNPKEIPGVQQAGSGGGQPTTATTTAVASNNTVEDSLSAVLYATQQSTNLKKLHSIKFLHIRFKEKYSFLTKRDQLLLKAPVGFRHSAHARQILKLGTEKYSDLLSLIASVEDIAFNANKLVSNEQLEEESSVTMEDFPTNKYYSREEIVFDVKDEFRGSVLANGNIDRCNVTVRVFVTSFLSGDPKVTVGFNDIQAHGSEQVRRCDVIPSSNDDWIAVNDVMMHRCCCVPGYEKGMMTFKPLDACRFELMRFTTFSEKPDLPINIRPSITVANSRIKLRCVLLSNNSHSSNKDTLTQVPCEKLSIRFPVPQQWVGSFQRKTPLRNAHAFRSRRIARQSNKDARTTHAILEASVGSAKYEHAYGSLVWYMDRFPEKNAAYNTPHVLTCNLDMNELEEFVTPSDDAISCQVEYTMPSSTASRSCIRSVALEGGGPQAERFTCYSSHYFYNLQVPITKDQQHSNNSAAGGQQCTVQ